MEPASSQESTAPASSQSVTSTPATGVGIHLSSSAATTATNSPGGGDFVDLGSRRGDSAKEGKAHQSRMTGSTGDCALTPAPASPSVASDEGRTAGGTSPVGALEDGELGEGGGSTGVGATASAAHGDGSAVGRAIMAERSSSQTPSPLDNSKSLSTPTTDAAHSRGQGVDSHASIASVDAPESTATTDGNTETNSPHLAEARGHLLAATSAAASAAAASAAASAASSRSMGSVLKTAIKNLWEKSPAAGPGRGTPQGQEVDAAVALAGSSHAAGDDQEGTQEAEGSVPGSRCWSCAAACAAAGRGRAWYPGGQSYSCRPGGSATRV